MALWLAAKRSNCWGSYLGIRIFFYFEVTCFIQFSFFSIYYQCRDCKLSSSIHYERAFFNPFFVSFFGRLLQYCHSILFLNDNLGQRVLVAYCAFSFFIYVCEAGFIIVFLNTKRLVPQILVLFVPNNNKFVNNFIERSKELLFFVLQRFTITSYCYLLTKSKKS